MKKKPASDDVAQLQAEVGRLAEELKEERRERHRLGVTLGSMQQVVAHGWHYGRNACPFCQSVMSHRDTCYLADEAGQMILAEYEQIERQRDRLAAIVEKARANGGVEALAEPTVHSLKSRLRRPGHG